MPMVLRGTVRRLNKILAILSLLKLQLSLPFLQQGHLIEDGTVLSINKKYHLA